MANDMNLDQLADDELDTLVQRRVGLIAKANALVAENKALVERSSAELANAEVNGASASTVTGLRESLEAQLARFNGRRGALVVAQHALENVEAERERRKKAGAQASAEGARAALRDYARSLKDEVTIAASSITTMLKELRIRAQAARDADFELRRATGVTELPGQLRFFDPYADVAVLEEAGAGITEVSHALERFSNGDLNAQVARKQVAEARERQQFAHRLAGEARERAHA
jgi:hypothetical protein